MRVWWRSPDLRLLLDECCSARLVVALRQAGHDVVYVQEDYPAVSDDRVIELARELDRIIVTEDFGFGERAVRYREPMPGLVTLAFGRETSTEQIAIVLGQFQAGDEAHRGRITTIDGTRSRFRLL
jgi:predicted nuclease of predicted toxin-antitoxin system